MVLYQLRVPSSLCHLFFPCLYSLIFLMISWQYPMWRSFLTGSINFSMVVDCYMEASRVPDCCGIMISLSFRYFLSILRKGFLFDSRSLDPLSAWVTSFHGYMLLTAWETSRTLLSKNYVYQSKYFVWFFSIAPWPLSFPIWAVIKVWNVLYEFMSWYF